MSRLLTAPVLTVVRRVPAAVEDEPSADEITVSAPFGRVDLEALKQPRLGGKEPST
jgi:hypothetical protein